jgi:hypothetical protein
VAGNSRNESVDEAEVERILDAARHAENVRTRRRRDALREVFVLDQRFVLKRFTWDPGTQHPRPLWKIEHEALSRLEGLPFPRSVGYRRRDHDKKAIMEYVRSYLPGSPVDCFGLVEARQAARLLAAAHARGVVTDDALKGNFLTLQDGDLGFVDLGRARVYPRPTPAMVLFVGRELAKFRRHCLEHQPELVTAFEEAYFDASPLKASQQGWAKRVADVTVNLRRFRKGVIQGRPDKA